MDARLTAAGLREVPTPASEYDHTLGTIEVPWFGEARFVPVIFAHDPDEPRYSDNQVAAFCSFIEQRAEFFAALPAKLLAYYDFARGDSPLHPSTIAELFPPLTDAYQLRSMIELQGILVSYYHGEPWCDYIGLLLECSWEVEHGLGVKVVANKVVELGFQDIVL